MPFETYIEIDDQATEELTRIAAQVERPRALMAAAGKGMESDLRQHFLSRNREPNAKGWPRKGFWKREGVDKTALANVSDNVATVAISSPAILHKLNGGTVSPQRASALSIPLTPEAYRVGSASLFPRKLTLIDRPGRPPLLVEKVQQKQRKTKTAYTPDGKKLKKVAGAKFVFTAIAAPIKWTIHYVLVKSVTHAPDPNTLPPQKVLSDSIIARARQFLARIGGTSRLPFE